MTPRLRTRLVLAGTALTAMAVVAGPANAATGVGFPGNRLVPTPRPCLMPLKPGTEIRPPRTCLPDVPPPAPCEWNPDKIICLHLPVTVALASSKSDLLPSPLPGPYDPITDMQGGIVTI